jgi:hypothetical protein
LLTRSTVDSSSHCGCTRLRKEYETSVGGRSADPQMSVKHWHGTRVSLGQNDRREVCVRTESPSRGTYREYTHLNIKLSMAPTRNQSIQDPPHDRRFMEQVQCRRSDKRTPLWRVNDTKPELPRPPLRHGSSGAGKVSRERLRNTSSTGMQS